MAKKSELKDKILKYALQNAAKFGGEANTGAVIGKVLAESPELKKDMKALAKEVNNVIKEISRLSVSEQESKLASIAPELLEQKKPEKTHELPELKNAKKRVVMRFAPSPSGPMHIGHALIISLNSEYCRKYNGKLLLRIEDTNSENIYEPAYGMLPEDGKWITKNNISDVIIQSDRLGIYYDYAEKLIEMGKGYVCTCSSEIFRQLVFEKKECPCRAQSKEEAHKRYNKMFSEYKAGEAVLRIKTDINDKNPAMRDFPLMRINDTAHPRKGTEFRVWPLMNFSVFVDDVEYSITHILRGKDHMDNAKRQEFLYRYFKKPIPETLFVGRINFTDLKISCSETRKLIEEGKYEGWSDIRLPFLAALKRRGYQPDAFIRYAMDIGISQNDKTVSAEEFFKIVNHHNKEVLDSASNRYFFVINPKEILIENAPEKEAELELHPDDPTRGKRIFSTKNSFYIAEKDLNLIEEGEVIRLMDCLNFTKKGKKFVFHSPDYETYKKEGKKIIHWLPVQKDLINVELLMPDKTPVKGFGEPLLKHIKEHDIVQLERIGFARLDKKEKNRLLFWFGHR